VFLLCFSVVSPTSFKNIETKWIPELRHHCPEVPVVLCGNKRDLRSDPEIAARLAEKQLDMVSFDQAVAMAKKHDCASYVENSALTQEGLKDVFDECIRCVVTPRRPADDSKCVVQ
jgi:Ras-related C3 botulinum toxin substrate 1